jgi:hypothetical protein
MAAVTPIDTPATDGLRQFYERIERTSRGWGYKHDGRDPAGVRWVGHIARRH